MHLEQFPDIPETWKNDELAEKWKKVRTVRRVVTGALELERAGKRIGSSLEAAPFVHITDHDLRAAIAGLSEGTEVALTDPNAARPTNNSTSPTLPPAGPSR